MVNQLLILMSDNHLFSNFMKSDSMVTSENNLQESSSILTKEQLAFLNEERQRHLRGKSTSYTWEQVKEMIRSKGLRSVINSAI